MPEVEVLVEEISTLNPPGKKKVKNRRQSVFMKVMKVMATMTLSGAKKS